MNLFWHILVLLALVSCSRDSGIAGGSTVETDNAMSLQIVFRDGTPVSGAMARIRPIWYVQDTVKSLSAFDAQADSTGKLVLQHLSVGTYFIEVRSQAEGAAQPIEIQNSINGLGVLTLKPLGSLQGAVTLPTGIDHAWVQIYGMDRVVKTDSLGRFRIDSLPPATIHLRAIANDLPSVFAEDVAQVSSGYTRDIGTLASASIYTENPGCWRYSRTIEVSSLFSDWMNPLPDTTIGFLRLDSANFDFSQTMTDGRDLRFFDEKGKRLVYQLANWDQVTEHGLIRIRLENPDVHSTIQMQWGCDGAVESGDDDLWKGISDSLLQELYSLQVADFESGTLLSKLSAPIIPHSWYLIAQDSTVQMLPQTENALDGIVPAEGGREGFAFHVSNLTEGFKWALFGLNLYDSTPRNLAHLDSVVFWVRGKGTLHFAFEKLTEPGGKTFVVDTLDSIWTRKSIRPVDFLPGDGNYGNIGWESIKYSITNLSFFAVGQTELWLDDIQLFGLNRDDLE